MINIFVEHNNWQIRNKKSVVRSAPVVKNMFTQTPVDNHGQVLIIQSVWCLSSARRYEFYLTSYNSSYKIRYSKLIEQSLFQFHKKKIFVFKINYIF